MPAYKDKKNSTWYALFWYKDWNGEQKRKIKRGFPTKRDALAYETDFKARVAGNLEMKMKDFVQVYMEERFPRLKGVTRETKYYVIRDKILPYFGEMPINEITSKEIIKWQNMLLSYRDSDGKPYSKSYLKEIHTQINAIFNYAVRYYKLPSNPASIAGNFGSDNEIKMNFWTTEEYLKFADQMMDEPPFYYYFQVLYWLGIREGEALALTKEDFDFEKKTVTINKTHQVLKSGKAIITTPKTPKHF
ncbi:MAG: Arm DNA-binding domain-containing protein [Eubacterium sp.]|nr:Arm DNA-binding domain-containing protein [Eubacterium sp.]